MPPWTHPPSAPSLVEPFAPVQRGVPLAVPPADRHADPSNVGVIVFSSSSRILHINDQARVLLESLGEVREQWSNLDPKSLPLILVQFCRELSLELERRASIRDWTQFELCRICHAVTPPFLLRGFGMPASSVLASQMIVTLQRAVLLPGC